MAVATVVTTEIGLVVLLAESTDSSMENELVALTECGMAVE